MEQEAVLSCSLNAILMRLVLEGEVEPIRPLPKGKKPRRPSLTDIYGRKVFHDLLKLMVLQYEAIGDKNDALEVRGIVDKVIARYGDPDAIPESDIRVSLEKQLLRITRPLRPTTTLKLSGIDFPEMLCQG